MTHHAESTGSRLSLLLQSQHTCGTDYWLTYKGLNTMPMLRKLSLGTTFVPKMNQLVDKLGEEGSSRVVWFQGKSPCIATLL
jgi:hypothetical protein